MTFKNSLRNSKHCGCVGCCCAHFNKLRASPIVVTAGKELTMSSLRGLETVVDSLGQSVEVAFQRMGTALERNVSMVNSVNSIMEHGLVSSIKLKMDIKMHSTREAKRRQTGNFFIQVTLVHEGRFPVFNASLSVWQQNANSTSPPEVPTTDPSSEHLFSLNPGDRLQWVLELESTPRTVGDQLEVAAVLCFPSPGTGKILQVKTCSTTHAINFVQFARSLADNSPEMNDRLEYETDFYIQPKFVREELLSLNPFEAMPTTFTILSAKNTTSDSTANSTFCTDLGRLQLHPEKCNSSGGVLASLKTWEQELGTQLQHDICELESTWKQEHFELQPNYTVIKLNDATPMLLEVAKVCNAM